jgi:hypothetical protein
LGRILVGGRDKGAGFAIGPRAVLTAHHVIRERGAKPVMFVPAGTAEVKVNVGPVADEVDAALLVPVSGESDLPAWLPVLRALPGAGWRVDSPKPSSNDPHLTGTVSTAHSQIEPPKRPGDRLSVVQLHVQQELGSYDGYSGSAVLDSLGRAAMALLVQQKLLRVAVEPGAAKLASNVLYAVPIDDVLRALDIAVPRVRPLRFRVELQRPGMIVRAGILDKIVDAVLTAGGSAERAPVVLLSGPGGVGKTVLAVQLANDSRIWTAFGAGIVMVVAGQATTPGSIADTIRSALDVAPNRDLRDALAGDPILIIVDDAWDPDTLDIIRANLPPSVTLAVTTRGVTVEGAHRVPVLAATEGEAIRILARSTPRSAELDHALEQLATTLFYWPFLLDLAAGQLHDDPGTGWEGDLDTIDATTTDAEQLAQEANQLAQEFPADPECVDELRRHTGGEPPRTVDFLIGRSLDRLHDDDRQRFAELAIYPRGAALTVALLSDLWSLTERATKRLASQLIRVGLVRRGTPPTLELHDLVVAWLHHNHGQPEDPAHQPTHQRLAGLAIQPDGEPATLTRDRAYWLAYHLVAARDWVLLERLPTRSWRIALLNATGSEAVLLAGLGLYCARAAHLTDPLLAAHHTIQAALFAECVQATAAQVPPSALVAMARLGRTTDALTRAVHHPTQAEVAISTVLDALSDSPNFAVHLDRVELLLTVGITEEVCNKLRLIVALRRLALDPSSTDAFMHAMEMVEELPDFDIWRRTQGYLHIALLITTIPSVDVAVDRVQQIPDLEAQVVAWGAIAERLADHEPARAEELLDRALAGAKTFEGQIGSRDLALRLAAQLTPGSLLKIVGGGKELAIDAVFNAADKCATLVRLAASVLQDDPRRARELLDQAQVAAQHIDESALVLRARASAEIAAALADIDPTTSDRLVEQGVTLAKIADGAPAQARWRSWERGLADVALRLCGANSRLVDRSVAIAHLIDNVRQRVSVLVAITQQVANRAQADLPDLAHAIRIASDIPREDGEDWDKQRSDALCAIASRLVGADPTAALDLYGWAAEAAAAINAAGIRASALRRVAVRIAAADPRSTAYADRAIAVADTIPELPEGNDRLAATADIAAEIAVADPSRSGELLERVIGAVGRLKPSSDVGGPLADIVRALAMTRSGDAKLINSAINLARVITEPHSRTLALVAVASRLVASDPVRAAGLFDAALDAAKAIPAESAYAHWRADLLSAVGEGVVTADRVRAEKLFDEAIAAANGIPDDKYLSRASALMRIAVRARAYDSERACQLFEIATACRNDTVPPPNSIFASLGEGELAEALELMLRIPMNSDDIDITIDFATALTDPELRAAVLAKLAASIIPTDPSRSGQIFEHAIEVAAAAARDDSRSDGVPFAVVARQLVQSDPVRALELFDRALNIARGDGWPRPGMLARIAEQLAPLDAARAQAVFDEAIEAGDAWDRGDLISKRNALFATIAGRDGDVATLHALIGGTLRGGFRHDVLSLVACFVDGAMPINGALAGQAAAVVAAVLPEFLPPVVFASS